MLDDMWETVNDYNAHAKADNCILFIKDIHFSIFCHETITGLRLLAPTVIPNIFVQFYVNIKLSFYSISHCIWKCASIIIC